MCPPYEGYPLNMGSTVVNFIQYTVRYTWTKRQPRKIFYRRRDKFDSLHFEMSPMEAITRIFENI